MRRRIRPGSTLDNMSDHLVSHGADILTKPLLANADLTPDYLPTEAVDSEDMWNLKFRKESFWWAFWLPELIIQWSQWLVNIFVATGLFFGRFLSVHSTSQNGSSSMLLEPCVDPLQVNRLKIIQKRVSVPFDVFNEEHQDALWKLWKLAYPDDDLPSLKCELWKKMGWQGSDPATDFRGAGFISLENLIFFAKNYPESFGRLLHKKDGRRAEWEYPFAVAGVNISFMLARMLGLRAVKPSAAVPCVRFAELLSADDAAFDELFCIAFLMLDATWLAMRASYINFNEVLKRTEGQLMGELGRKGVRRVRDVPGYGLLKRG